MEPSEYENYIKKYENGEITFSIYIPEARKYAQYKKIKSVVIPLLLVPLFLILSFIFIFLDFKIWSLLAIPIFLIIWISEYGFSSKAPTNILHIIYILFVLFLGKVSIGTLISVIVSMLLPHIIYYMSANYILTSILNNKDDFELHYTNTFDIKNNNSNKE